MISVGVMDKKDESVKLFLRGDNYAIVDYQRGSKVVALVDDIGVAVAIAQMLEDRSSK